jgi:AcrR family transcriptional regulator
MSRPANPDLKTKIRYIGISEINKKGFTNINLRDISKKVGITPTTIYYYYKNKEALFLDIKTEVIAMMDNYIISRIPEKENPVRMMEIWMDGFITWCLEFPELSRLIFDKLPNKIEDKINSKSYYKAREIIEEGRRTGVFKVKESELYVTLGIASMYGLVLILLSEAYDPKFKTRKAELKTNLIKMFIEHIKKYFWI